MADRNLRFSSCQGFNPRPHPQHFIHHGNIPQSQQGLIRLQGHIPVVQSGQGHMMNIGQGNMMNTNQGHMMNPSQGQMMNTSQGHMMNTSQGQMMHQGQMMTPGHNQMMQASQGQMMNPGHGHMMNTSQGHMMNPNQGQMMHPGQGQMMAPMLASQGQMMMSSHRAPMMSQGQGQMMPQGQMFPARGPAPMHHGQNMVGMRMHAPVSSGPPGVAPPPYSQAHAASFQHRNKSVGSTGHHGNQKPAKTEEQLQKEKYFQQQQAKLKQFKTSGGAGLDPNKLIDSMFGGHDTVKPKPVKKVQAEVSQPDDSDDGFGDFLGSPETDVASTQPAVCQADIPGTTSQSSFHDNQTQQPQQPAPAMPAAPKQDKKDLAKMMLDSCDLTAPQKAKLFVKPSLKELPATSTAPSGPQPALVTTKPGAWNKAQELSDLFIQEAAKDEQTRSEMAAAAVKATSPTSKHPPKPPPWLSDDSLIPPLYRHVLEASLVEGQITTERLYPILMMSGLLKEVLGHLWSLCNKTTPGQLTTPELYKLLAVIALTQNNFKVESTEILSRCPQAPLPFLSQTGTSPGTIQVPGPGTAPVMSVAPGAASVMAVVPGAAPVIAVAPGHLPPSPGTTGTIHSFPYPTAAPAPVSMATGTDILPLAASPPAPVPGPPSAPTHMTTFPSLPVQVSVQDTGVMGPGVAAMMSSPATISVTNLPPAVTPQRMIGNMVQVPENNDDDFADFQAASPVVTAAVGLTTTPSVVPVLTSKSVTTNSSKFVYKPSVPDEDKTAGCLSPSDIHGSTVANFFGTDDSSDVAKVPHKSIPATSPDDDYFDGYKSADSKPSDSTSQFSTDQSEGEDFKNFENYLDEFQRKKEQLDKESPLHRPIPKFSLPEIQPPSPSRMFPKASVPTKIPMPATVQGSRVKQAPVSSDEFSDFADFQSAPPSAPAEATPDIVNPAVDAVKKTDDLKSSGSASDLIGDEDKYAALRCLDFSEPPEESKTVFSETEAEATTGTAPVDDDDDENWANFQTASNEGDSTSSSKPVSDSILKTDLEGEDSDWAAFETAATVEYIESDKSGVSSNTDDQYSMAAKSSTDLFKEVSEPVKTNIPQHVLQSNWQGESEGSVSDDWADFQDGSTTVTSNSNEQNSGNNTVDKKSEILGLFSSNPPIIPSTEPGLLDERSAELTAQSTSGEFGSVPSPPSVTSNVEKSEKQKRVSVDDDFMKPPPIDDIAVMDDDDFGDGFGSFTRGYDLDHMHQPNLGDNNKKMYGGIYGVNQNSVVTGHRKQDSETKGRQEGSKAVSIEITKYPADTDKDNDTDSVSSKDNDMFQGKFGLGKELGEDSQSVSSLDFVVNKRLQTLKDGDSQSMTSSEFGNFETGDGGLPESKSVDSLDLRQSALPESKSVDSLELTKDYNNGSADSSDKDTKDESPERETKDAAPVVFELETSPGPSFPIVGDRYSNIMHDIQGSDKHAFEWQRCLDNCCRMIQDANNVFNSISSSSVCNEVMRSSQGSQYIQGVIEIYKVACKIMVSMKKTGIHSDKLSQFVKDIDIAWNNLTAFLVGGSVMPDDQCLDFSHGFLTSDDTTSQYRACGVCVLDVDLKVRGQGQINDNAKLTYGGRQYHSPCANFWINCVDSTLPALKLPELL